MAPPFALAVFFAFPAEALRRPFGFAFFAFFFIIMSSERGRDRATPPVRHAPSERAGRSLG